LFKLKEEHRFGMYDNYVPRTICRPKEMEVTGSWKELFNGELHDCTLPNIIRVNETRNIYQILIGKSDSKSTVFRPRLHKDCASYN
jgi:hypothetical protein